MARLLSARHSDHGFTATQMEDALGDDDDMDYGTISVEHIPVVYWEFVGAVIAAFALWHIYELLICRQRLSAASKGKVDPARPRNFLTRCLAMMTAIMREISNATLPAVKFRGIVYPSPSFGTYAIALANAVLLVVLCFYRFDTADIRNFQHIAYRAGFISLGQLPLLFLLSSKHSILGYFIGYSYERLNWLHRWVARCLLLTTTIHLGYWFGDWAPFGYVSTQVRTDYTTQTGLSAWCILVWIACSSFAPIRNWNYEFFVLQHLVSFIAFIVMIVLHTPAEDHVWIWIGVGIFAFDRVVRAASMIYTNLAVFHKKARQQGSSIGSWACKGHLEPLPYGVVRFSIPNPPFSWQPGQHTFVSCHSVVPLQAHPFTITSIPSDNKLEFLVRAHAGGTKRLYDFANKNAELPSNLDLRSRQTLPMSLQGPYGYIRPMQQFDSIVLLAGGVGANFVIPLLRDVICRLKSPTRRSGLLNWLAPAGVATRHIRLVWVVKSKEQLSWHGEQLSAALDDVTALRSERHIDISLEVSVYVTCDDTFTSEYNNALVSQPAATTKSSDQLSPRLLDDVEKSAEAPKSCCSSKVKKPEQSTDSIGVVEVDPRSETRRRKVKTCGADGTCCCQTTIKNESANAVSEAAVCRCNVSDDEDGDSCCGTSSDSPKSSPPKASKEKAGSCCGDGSSQKPLVHPLCTILSGRPHPRTIIRRSLEQARGETAVVACGPKGMNTDVRRTVVALSDERAVHKGTGAQGVFFWAEGFGW
ncbi:MAG: hypothetical protein M1828_006197 [Chrysothrix sp. TS-e1954]|nr:MAG: hypothetical protein M1828_006197 [Chrysothrix sp. TS-e1954]